MCELRRQHPRWGPGRLAREAARWGVEAVPSRMGVYRALVRHGLIQPATGRCKQVFRRWERDALMELWQMPIVGGVLVRWPRGQGRDRGVDDHSRHCVIAKAVLRATGQKVCLALVDALSSFGAPGEVLTDNSKQFTARFGHDGEVLFDRICRDNGITHRLTQPRSPPPARWSGFTKACVGSYSTTPGRSPIWPCGCLGGRLQHRSAASGSEDGLPGERFTPVPQAERELLPLHVLPFLISAPQPGSAAAEETGRGRGV